MRRARGGGPEVDMAKADVEVLRTATRVDLLARIIELKDAVEWRDRKLAEQEATIARLRELLGETRAKLSEHGLSVDSPAPPPSPR